MTTPAEVSLRAGDGATLFVRSLGAEDAARTLVIVHGYGEHGGRYVQRAERFVAAGYRVLIPDVRGHGRSSGPRGYVDRFSRYLADLAVVLEHAGTGTIDVIGHSHGGLIVAAGLTSEQGLRVHRVALTSPFLGLSLTPPAWKIRAAVALSRWLPRVSLPSEIRPEDVSHDPVVVAAYAADPLNHHVNNARWYTEAMAAIEGAFARAARVPVPVLVLQAGDDRLVSPDAARRWAAAAPAALARFEMVDGAYHEILFEPDGARHAERILEWFDAS